MKNAVTALKTGISAVGVFRVLFLMAVARRIPFADEEK